MSLKALSKVQVGINGCLAEFSQRKLHNISCWHYLAIIWRHVGRSMSPASSTMVCFSSSLSIFWSSCLGWFRQSLGRQPCDPPFLNNGEQPHQRQCGRTGQRTRRSRRVFLKASGKVQQSSVVRAMLQSVEYRMLGIGRLLPLSFKQTRGATKSRTAHAKTFMQAYRASWQLWKTTS